MRVIGIFQGFDCTVSARVETKSDLMEALNKAKTMNAFAISLHGDFLGKTYSGECSFEAAEEICKNA